MSTEFWLEKAECLRQRLADVNSALIDGIVDSPQKRRELEQATIARWLRSEFSDDPPEDTATIPLFVETHR